MKSGEVWSAVKSLWQFHVRMEKFQRFLFECIKYIQGKLFLLLSRGKQQKNSRRHKKILKISVTYLQ